MFSVINGVMLRPLPFPEPDRLAMLYVVDGTGRDFHGGINTRKMFADTDRIEAPADHFRNGEPNTDSQERLRALGQTIELDGYPYVSG